MLPEPTVRRPSRHRRAARRRASAAPITITTFGALSAGAALLLAACTGDDEQAATTSSTIAVTTTTIAPRSSDGVLTIGALLPRTGPGAALGIPMIEAIADSVAEINGAGGVLDNRVRLEIADENSGTGLDDLLAAGVDAVVGPASSTVALSTLGDAVSPVTGVVVCSPTATALSLDSYPDNRFFFRTIPSDSLQMEAIGRRVELTGVDRVSVGYLDDRYGRGLLGAFEASVAARNRLDLQATVPFGADQQELGDVADALLASGPGVIVVLADADDGTRLLAALDAATTGTTPPLVIVNDAIRGNRQAIQSLSNRFRENLTGVAPLALPVDEDASDAFFAANAVDCVNLIALSAIQSASDQPIEIQKNMASVSGGGRPCTSFADCTEKLKQGLQIDYNGLSGEVELSTTTGDLVQARFEVFGFDEQGVDHSIGSPILVP